MDMVPARAIEGFIENLCQDYQGMLQLEKERRREGRGEKLEISWTGYKIPIAVVRTHCLAHDSSSTDTDTSRSPGPSM